MSCFVVLVNDAQVVVKYQELQQYNSKGREEEACEQENKRFNQYGFQMKKQKHNQPCK